MPVNRTEYKRQKTYLSLDTPQPVRLGYGEYGVSGWYVPGPGVSQELSLIVDGEMAQVFQGIARADVADHLSLPEARYCGFVARFKPHKQVSSWKLAAKAPTGNYILAELRLKIDPVSPGSAVPGQAADYEDWLIRFEPDLFWRASEIPRRLAELSYKPLVSVILPTFNTHPYYLTRALQSVLDQHYPHWQLCVADDASTDPRVLTFLRRAAARDPRIQIVARQAQGGISAASNSALAIASGEFVVLLDHDDELHPFALLEVARALNEGSRMDLIYSDEDKIDLLGKRAYPAFKPDFDPDIFLSFDYLGHLIALRRSVMTGIGGFRTRCDGAQDWDLLVRAVECISESGVHHIAKPLYHWRAHEHSTASSLDAKPYVRQAWRTVLTEHVVRTGKPALAERGLFDGSMRLKLPAKSHRVAVLVRTQDGSLQEAVLRQSARLQNTSIYSLTGCFACRLDARENSSCSLHEIEADVFVFINDPLEEVNHYFFEELAGQAMRADCGIATGISIDPEKRILHSGFQRKDERLTDPFAGTRFPGPGYMGLLQVVRSVEAISHHFFAASRRHLTAIGGFGVLSDQTMPELVAKLTEYARGNQLRLLVTPYAVATFDFMVGRHAPDRRVSRRERDIAVNPNLSAFPDWKVLEPQSR
jgi:hypothetical protein